jgi:hypothetical protein
LQNLVLSVAVDGGSVTVVVLGLLVEDFGTLSAVEGESVVDVPSPTPVHPTTRSRTKREVAKSWFRISS